MLDIALSQCNNLQKLRFKNFCIVSSSIAMKVDAALHRVGFQGLSPKVILKGGPLFAAKIRSFERQQNITHHRQKPQTRVQRSERASSHERHHPGVLLHWYVLPQIFIADIHVSKWQGMGSYQGRKENAKLYYHAHRSSYRTNPHQDSDLVCNLHWSDMKSPGSSVPSHRERLHYIKHFEMLSTPSSSSISSSVFAACNRKFSTFPAISPPTTADSFTAGLASEYTHSVSPASIDSFLCQMQ